MSPGFIQDLCLGFVSYFSVWKDNVAEAKYGKKVCHVEQSVSSFAPVDLCASVLRHGTSESCLQAVYYSLFYDVPDTGPSSTGMGRSYGDVRV